MTARSSSCSPPRSSTSTSASAVSSPEYLGVDLEPFLALEAEIVEAPVLPSPVSSDPDDDKFLACAVAGGVAAIVSGDRDLLVLDGWRELAILRPRQFLEQFLEGG